MMKSQIPVLTLLVKPECPLCLEVLEIFMDLRNQFTFMIDTRDITADGHLYDVYKEAIPVVLYGEKEIARYPLSYADGERIIRSLVR